MIKAEHHLARRTRLHQLVDGPILLLGNGARARNLPMTGLPFRQDSTFLYYTGCHESGAAALLHEGRFDLFLEPLAEDDVLWHGPRPSPHQVGASLGADRVFSSAALLDKVPRHVRVLAVADEARNHHLSAALGVALRFGAHHGDEELMDAVIAMRRTKGDEELEELRQAAEITGRAFAATMAATHVGGHEHQLNTLFEAMLQLEACVPGYDTILTQAGEVLHNHSHDQPLTDGRMVLLDGGGERPSGYTVDITRTWPTSGRFSPRQRAAYDAVLEAQQVAIARCERGTRFREVHDAASLILARFLVDEGLLKGAPADLVERGAHALFFPHGVGHHLGLDVHDLENFGDRPSYPPGQGRPSQFGTANLRLDLPLEEDWVVTIEPGLYFVPAIFDDKSVCEPFEPVLNRERLAEWMSLGGIRIEDDVHITNDQPEVLTTVPKRPDDVESPRWLGSIGARATMWLLIVGVAAALIAYMALAAWHGRMLATTLHDRPCPACGDELKRLSGPDLEDRPTSYEVYGCGNCGAGFTALHGSRSNFAYCPSCRQLALEIGLSRREEPGSFEASEHCQICGYQATHHIGGGHSHENDDDNVIPFPGPRR